jgi:hypothetical protein
MAFTTKHEPEPYSRLDEPPDPPAHAGASAPADPPVANLIEGYRSKRQAWIAEAEALARMRDDVRGAAERERMEIITRARERARAVISTARRDLLTLSAQVEASLGPAEPPKPVAELFRGGTRRPLGGPGGGAGTPGRSPERRWTLEDGAARADSSRADLDSLRREK